MLAALKRFLTRRLWGRRPWGQVFNPTATELDLRWAYRLLLYRDPDPEGWVWFSRFLKNNRPGVRELVELFVSTEEFKRLHWSRRTLAEGDHALIDVGPFKMYVPSGDPVIVPGLLAGDYEPHVTALVKKTLKPGMVFADLGANLGYFSLLGASLVGPAGKVIACEASPRNAALLWASAGVNRFTNIDVHPRALLDRRTMLAYEGCGANGSVRPLAAEEGLQGVVGAELVPADTLDSLLAGQERLDVIKIDIEGAEHLAFAGGEGALRRYRPVIISEFFPELLRRVSGLDDPAEYLGRFTRAGYTLAVVCPPDGRLVECGTSADRVLALYEEQHRPPHCGTHLDILAVPA